MARNRDDNGKEALFACLLLPERPERERESERASALVFAF